MKLLVLLLTLAVALCAGDKISFNNYKVYRATTLNYEHVEFLKNLQAKSDAFNFWTDAGRPDKNVDIMVPPHKQGDFESMMNYQHIPFTVMIEDVQKDIDRETVTERAEYGWKAYYALDETNAWLKSLVQKFPQQVELLDLGKSYEGRSIVGVKVSFGKNKPAVFLDAGIHAREWITTATATYLLNQFLTSTDPAVKNLAQSYDWYIFPNVNPDGYEYTQKHDRMWRKTRQPHGFCNGADPNRNFAYKWMNGGASSEPCWDTYAGPKAFSEPETLAVSKFVTSISKNLKAYLSFHSYSQVILWPYGHTSEHLDNHDHLEKMAKSATTALAKRHGTKYTYGNIVEAMYVATGGSMDWVKGNYKTPITFTYELRDTGRYGFLLPPEQIIPCGEEVLDSLVALFQTAKDLGY